MRAVLVVLLVGCTSTRQLASTTDVRLRTGGHTAGFVVKTDERWRERIDPNTVVQLESKEGAWSPQLRGSDLHVDDHGVWFEVGAVRAVHFADQIEIAGASDELIAALVSAKPRRGELHQAGSTVVMAGDRDVLGGWLAAVIPGPRVYSIRVHTPEQGWRAPLYNSRLVDMALYTTATKLGWHWNEIAAIKVRNVSGGKTALALVATSIIGIVAAPGFLITSRLGAAMRNYDGPAGRSAGPTLGDDLWTAAKVVDLAAAIDRGNAAGTWEPVLAPAESLSARPLFSTGAQWRAVIRPTLAFDAGATTDGNNIGSGVMARIRLTDLFEIGGGAREVWTRDEVGWQRSTTHVFQIGMHLPLDAGFRFAIPLGFEASGGGAVAHDMRIPWGLRYTSKSGRTFVTALPATPQWVRSTKERDRHWAWNTSAEVGVSF